MWPPSSVRFNSMTTNEPFRSKASKSTRRRLSSHWENSSANISKFCSITDIEPFNMRCRSSRSLKDCSCIVVLETGHRESCVSSYKGILNWPIWQREYNSQDHLSNRSEEHTSE